MIILSTTQRELPSLVATDKHTMESVLTHIFVQVTIYRRLRAVYLFPLRSLRSVINYGHGGVYKGASDKYWVQTYKKNTTLQTKKNFCIYVLSRIKLLPGPV